MDSGRLGELGNNLRTDENPNALMRYEDVAAAGLDACITAYRGETEDEFIDLILTWYPDKEVLRTDILNLWFGARNNLCPNVTEGDTGSQQDGGLQSHDLILP